MPKPTSRVEVCNLGLSQINQKPIASIDPPDEGSEAATQCAAWYDTARLETLRHATWGFARKRYTVVADTNAPAFGWSKAYTLPNDYVRQVDVKFGDISLTDDEYEIEDGKLLCNEDGTLQLVYIYDHDNPAAWSPDFTTTFSSNLAKWVGPSLSASDGNTTRAEIRTNEGLKSARQVNGQENKPERREYSRLLARRLRARGGTVRIR